MVSDSDLKKILSYASMWVNPDDSMRQASHKIMDTVWLYLIEGTVIRASCRNRQ